MADAAVGTTEHSLRLSDHDSKLRDIARELKRLNTNVTLLIWLSAGALMMSTLQWLLRGVPHG